MKPTPDTEIFYDIARQAAELAQDCLSGRDYELAAYNADTVKDAWLKVEWEKQ